MLVVYGFHPFESYAVEIGEILKGTRPQDVEVIQFTPKSIGEDFLEQNITERIKRNWKGVAELKNHIESIYEKPRFSIVLHCYPFLLEEQYLPYEILYPAWNFELKRVIEEFASKYNKTKKSDSVWFMPASPRGFIGYHSSDIEYFPRRRSREGELLVVSEQDGVEFTLDYLKWIRQHYLRL